MVTAKRKMHVEEDGTEVSLGQVGEPGAVRTGLLESLLDSGIVSAPCGKQPPGALRPRRSRPPARSALGAPDEARGGLQPRPASATDWQRRSLEDVLAGRLSDQAFLHDQTTIRHTLRTFSP